MTKARKAGRPPIAATVTIRRVKPEPTRKKGAVLHWRATILGVLGDADGPLTASELIKRCGQTVADRSNYNRARKQLQDAGLIVGAGGQRSRSYALAPSEEQPAATIAL